MANEAFEKESGCEHDYMLDEEIGMCCRLCGHVGSEIKHVSAPFVSETSSPLYKHIMLLRFINNLLFYKQTRTNLEKITCWFFY